MGAIEIRLLLIRHGQSTWNAQGRWQGRADPPLTSLGEAQARHAATRLAEIDTLRVVTSSTLQRARRTAEILAAATSLDLQPGIGAFDERSAGAWEGLTRVEIDRHYPGWLDVHRRPDDYEADDSVAGRAVAAVGPLAEAAGTDRLALVTHGGVIGTLEKQAGAPWQRLSNLEGRWFRWDGASLEPVGERVHLLEAFEETRPASPDYA